MYLLAVLRLPNVEPPSYLVRGHIGCNLSVTQMACRAAICANWLQASYSWDAVLHKE